MSFEGSTSVAWDNPTLTIEMNTDLSNGSPRERTSICLLCQRDNMNIREMYYDSGNTRILYQLSSSERYRFKKPG